MVINALAPINQAALSPLHYACKVRPTSLDLFAQAQTQFMSEQQEPKDFINSLCNKLRVDGIESG